MSEYSSEKLMTLSNTFIRALYAAQYYHGENARQDEHEAGGNVVNGVGRGRLVYLGDLHMGFMWELYLFLKKDQGLISKLKSTPTQRSRLRDMRNSIFHPTSTDLASKRFKEFRKVSTGDDWRLVFKQDLEIIGNYIHSLHAIRNPANARSFMNFWMGISPFR